MRLGERISVVASFGPPYRMRPVRFRWGGRLFEVKEVTYDWQTTEGRARLYHFCVSDGSSIYEISFDSSSLLWRLEEAAEDF